MSGKRSAVEALSLRETLTRSRTVLRWLHSDVNVSDGLMKVDHRFDPTFTSAKKLCTQARVKKSQSRKAPPVLTPEDL